MKMGTLLQLTTVATQTEPGSVCCDGTSYCGVDDDDFDCDVNEEEHFYWLHEECFPTLDQAVTIKPSDHMTRSATDDDGYDVIFDGENFDDHAVNFMRDKKQFRNDNFDENNGIRLSVNVESTRNDIITGWRPPPLPAAPSTACRNPAAMRSTPGEDCGRVQRRLNPTCRDSAVFEQATTPQNSRRVPTMGTRLRIVRHQQQQQQQEPQSSLPHHQHLQRPQQLSVSDSEKSSRSDTSRLAFRECSSDGDTPVGAGQLDGSSLSSDSQSASEEPDIWKRPLPPLPQQQQKHHRLSGLGTDCMNCKSVVINSSKNTSSNLAADKEDDETANGKTSGKTRRQVYDHYVDVMYTNQANLEHTIMVQQRLFQQSLADTARGASTLPRHFAVSQVASPLPNSTKQQKSRDLPRSPQAANDDSNNGYKWVVRRRKDGTRYVTRARCRDDEPETTRRPPADDATCSKRRQKPVADATEGLRRRVTCDETNLLTPCPASHDAAKISKDVAQQQQLLPHSDKQFSGNLNNAAGLFESRAQQQRNQHPILAVITI